jgi:hypothetical protein
MLLPKKVAKTPNGEIINYKNRSSLDEVCELCIAEDDEEFPNCIMMDYHIEDDRYLEDDDIIFIIKNYDNLK